MESPRTMKVTAEAAATAEHVGVVYHNFGG